MADFDSVGSSSSTDSELQEFLMIEKQKAQVNAQVWHMMNKNMHLFIDGTLIFSLQIHEFNEICWDKCIGKPGSKLDSATETCLANCVDRFIDTSLLITQRFAQLLQKNSGGM